MSGGTGECGSSGGIGGSTGSGGSGSLSVGLRMGIMAISTCPAADPEPAAKFRP